MSPNKIERKANVILVGFYRAAFMGDGRVLNESDLAGQLGFADRKIQPEVLEYLVSIGSISVDQQCIALTNAGLARGKLLVEQGFGTGNA